MVGWINLWSLNGRKKTGHSEFCVSEDRVKEIERELGISKGGEGIFV